MRPWKQAIVSSVLVAAAAAGWHLAQSEARSFLARIGIEWASASQDEPLRRSGSGAASSIIVTSAVTLASASDTLAAIGDGRAVNSAAVVALGSGTVTQVLVEPGESVRSGQAVARLDSRTEEIAVSRAEVALWDAEAKLARAVALQASRTVAAVQVEDARLAADNARLALEEAELALSRRTVVSPIDGVVGLLSVDEGSQVAAQSVVTTVDDRSSIVVEFRVHERHAGMIARGARLSAVPTASPGDSFEGEVSAVDSRIDVASRTMKAEGRLANAGDALRPGMSFKVSMSVEGDVYPSVDPAAVQWSADGPFVWAVNGGKAERIGVAIVQRNADSVLVIADLAEGTHVVTEGVHAVRPGLPVETRLEARDSGGEGDGA